MDTEQLMMLIKRKYGIYTYIKINVDLSGLIFDKTSDRLLYSFVSLEDLFQHLL